MTMPRFGFDGREFESPLARNKILSLPADWSSRPLLMASNPNRRTVNL